MAPRMDCSNSVSGWIWRKDCTSMDGSLLFIGRTGPGRAMNRAARRTASGPIRFPVNTGGLCKGPNKESGNALAGTRLFRGDAYRFGPGFPPRAQPARGPQRVDQGEIAGIEPFDAA